VDNKQTPGDLPKEPATFVSRKNRSLEGVKESKKFGRSARKEPERESGLCKKVTPEWGERAKERSVQDVRDFVGEHRPCRTKGKLRGGRRSGELKKKSFRRPPEGGHTSGEESTRLKR